MLSEKACQEFKQIYFDKYGKQLDDLEANTKGMELLNFFKLIYKPIPREVFRKLTNNIYGK